MGSWSSPKAKRLVGALTLGLVGLFTVSCGEGKAPGVDGDPDPDGLATSDRCATPNDGCACATPQKVVDCGTFEREAEGQIWCSVGHRTCGDDGKWGKCEVEDLQVLPAPSRGVSPQGLGNPDTCEGKPCDPYCQQVTDSGKDLELPMGIQPTGDGGITLISKQGNLNDTECTGIRVVPEEETLTVVSMPTAGGPVGNGLRGEYFNQLFVQNDDYVGAPTNATPALTRVDPQLNFDWAAAPGAPLGADGFTVRWTGWIRPLVTRQYQVCIESDDGSVLYLDDRQETDEIWYNHGPEEDCSAAYTLTAGLRYKIRVDFYEDGGNATMRLRWRHPDAPAGELIPAAALLPPEASPPTDLLVEPDAVQFQAFAVPEGCFEGPLRAAWTVDRLDRSRVDSTGRVSLFAPVAGDITVTAYVGAFEASGVVHVNVDAVDSYGAPEDAIDAFDDTPMGADDLDIVYPYAETVFPLALRPPTVQWNSPTAAEAVKVSVFYPDAGTPIFSWSKIMPSVAPGRYTLPAEVWANLGATAKGGRAGLSVERVVGGVLRDGESRPIVFAEAPLRGKIYYTQYGRNGTNAIMVADPGSPNEAKPVFATEAATGNKCPVCHSMSANGNMFATADRSFSINGGLSRIDPLTGAFTKLSDYPLPAGNSYRAGADDWRGFAWAAITPDGAFALAANNIWGNSREQMVGITTGAQTVVPSQQLIQPTGVISGGSGTGLLARYFLNTTASGWDWRRFDGKVDFNWAAGPGGPVGDGFSTTWTGEVQGFTSEQYTFRVTTTGGVRLTVDGVVLIDNLAHSSAGETTFTGNAPLTAGQRTSIALEFRDNGGAARIALAWSSPTIAPSIIPQTQLYPNDGEHGVVATYYRNADFTQPFITDRLEANVDATWGTGGPRPLPVGDDDNSWSASYRGRMQVPVAGNLILCASSDDGVTVEVDGEAEITSAGVLAYGCMAQGSAIPVTQGQLVPFEVRLREDTGDAYVRLYWRIVNAAGQNLLPDEIIPSARLLPPAGWVAPTRGLSVAYYDNDNFNGSAGAADSRATRRIETSVDLVWGAGRPEYSSAITDSDSFSARFTGQLEAPCAGDYDFEVEGNDGGRVYIDGERVVQGWSAGTRQGTKRLTAGLHSIKIDHHELTQDARMVLRWKPHCQMATAYTVIPTANLYPTIDSGTNGYVLLGGDNPSDTSYFVWQLPGPMAPANTPAVDVSDLGSDKVDRWGLGGATMMVPSFSPDATKLVFIDGDSGFGNGWRKGLSTFDFDYEAKRFSNRRTIVSTFPSGDVMKWPVFESDSRSVLYQATVPADRCCFNNWKLYGFMGPTNYFEDPGRIMSVDTAAATPTPVELTRLNQGERAEDRNKAYQATMLPQAAAGYRWAVFTSTRPYGNTLNLQSQKDFSNPASYSRITDTAKIQSMLWVSAIDDEVSGAADRSHPSFFLPNQNFSEDAARGYINERAYWVADACRQPGTDAASSCDVDEDCCGAAEGRAVCRIDTPVANPPTRHCFQLPDENSCVMNGQACATSEECCGTGNVCDDGVCAKPPSLARYAAANYSRVYESNCGAGQQVEWTAFEFKASVPAPGGALEFYAETADDPGEFRTLPASPNAVDTSAGSGVVHLGTEGPPGMPMDWRPIAVNARLKDAKVVQRKFLKMTIRFVPNLDRTAAPVLTGWRQTFSCPPAE